MKIPIKIRGVTYPTAIEAARALGVNTTTIANARRLGRLDYVGLGTNSKGARKGRRGNNYDPLLDAEHILGNILHRQNWSVAVRDALAKHLESVTRKGVPITKIEKGK